MICSRILFKYAQSSFKSSELVSGILRNSPLVSIRQPGWQFSRGLRSRQIMNSKGEQNGSSSSGVLLRSAGMALGGSVLVYNLAFVWKYENDLSSKKPYWKTPKGAYATITDKINKTWRNLLQTSSDLISSGSEIFWCIASVNTLVYLAWQVPRLNTVMMRYFTCSPLRGAPVIGMLLSMFSHQNFLHLAINMYVLHGFSKIMISSIGKEQFTALYVSGGLSSSLMSRIVKLVRGVSTVSVGASGAIFAVFGCFCAFYPNQPIQIIFIPVSFSAESGALGIMALDALGVVLGWRLLDHAGHLGGMLYGLFYGSIGQPYIWNNSNAQYILKVWSIFRKPDE